MPYETKQNQINETEIYCECTFEIAFQHFVCAHANKIKPKKQNNKWKIENLPYKTNTECMPWHMKYGRFIIISG